MTRQEVEDFLYREALFMDDHRYQDWLSLWRDDGVYWVPCALEPRDANQEVSIIYDDRAKISDRAVYLDMGTVNDAPSRSLLRRVISNIQVKFVGEREAEAESNFVLVECRDAGQFIWGGRSVHRLHQTPDGIKMSFKKVLLTNRRQPLSTMQFLI